MKLLIEAFPMQPYRFKMIFADDDVRNIGTAWVDNFYTKLQEYAESYPINEIIIYGPDSFAEEIVKKVTQEKTEYTSAPVKFVSAIN